MPKRSRFGSMTMITVFTQTGVNVLNNPDILHLILSFLGPEANALLYLAWTCKHLFQTIMNNNHSLWFDICMKIQNKRLAEFKSENYRGSLSVQHLSVLPQNDLRMALVPNFRVLHNHLHYFTGKEKAALTWPPRELSPQEKIVCSQIAQKITFLECGKTCAICGVQTQTFPVWKLGKKYCVACFRDNIITSNELFLTYGIDFWTLFKTNKEYMIKNVFCFRQLHNGTHPTSLGSRYHWNHITGNNRFGVQQLVHRPPSVFFWRPHLEQMVNFHDSVQIRELKRQYAQILTAKIRAFYLRSLLAHRGHPSKKTLEMIDAEHNKNTEGHFPTKVEVVHGIRNTLLHRPLSSIDGKRANQYVKRFRTLHTPSNDRNPRKMLDLIRSHEAMRYEKILTFPIPGVDSQTNYQLRNEFVKYVDGY